MPTELDATDKRLVEELLTTARKKLVSICGYLDSQTFEEKLMPLINHLDEFHDFIDPKTVPRGTLVTKPKKTKG